MGKETSEKERRCFDVNRTRCVLKVPSKTDDRHSLPRRRVCSHLPDPVLTSHTETQDLPKLCSRGLWGRGRDNPRPHVDFGYDSSQGPLCRVSDTATFVDEPNFPLPPEGFP